MFVIRNICSQKVNHCKSTVKHFVSELVGSVRVRIMERLLF